MKKLLIILLAMAMSLSMASCTKRDDNGSSDTTSQSSEVSVPETDESAKVAEALLPKLKSQYGKRATIKYVGTEKIGGEDCFVFNMESEIITKGTFAANADVSKIYEKEMGSGTFLPMDEMVTPAKYFIDLLQTTYAGNFLRDINAVGAQIKAGTYKSYPTDFPAANSFPTLTDTEQLIYLYSADAYLDENFEQIKLVTAVLPIKDGFVMTFNPSMVEDGFNPSKLTLSNFKFEKDFDAEKFAKDNNLQILKGKQVK